MSIFSQWGTSPGVWRQPVALDLPTAPTPPGAQTVDGESGPFVDRGMEIPESYGVDVVRALVQDPFHIMVYWELRPESLDALRALFPNGASAPFTPTMRLTDIDTGGEAYISVPQSGKYWFDVVPDRRYRVDVGARSAEHGFVPITRSNVVTTPRGTVASTVDDDPRYRIETPKFVRLLQVTGFASDRVLVDLARAEAGIETGEAPAFAAAPPQYLVEAFGKLPEGVRSAAVMVARGETLTDDLVEELPDDLRHVLEVLRARGELEVLTAAFMHLLPQMLRRILEAGHFVEGAHPLHLPPRFAIGSSEAIHRPQVDWSWMPSMAEARVILAPEIAPDALDPETEL
jgi:hypothetical protein